MTRSRKHTRTPEQVNAIRSKIVLLIEQGPKTSAEIAASLGIGGSSLGNDFKELLRSEAISRVELSKGRYRYYIGQTAPAASDKAEIAKKAEPKRMQYAVPVRKVIVRPFSIAGENGTSAEITLPAAPWEAAA